MGMTEVNSSNKAVMTGKRVVSESATGHLAEGVVIVDKDGNPVGVGGRGDLTNDAWGVQLMSLPKSLFHGLWTFDIPATMWFMYESGTQVYTSTNIISTGGVAQLTADATHNPVLMESRECPRYQPDRGHRVADALWLPNKTNDGVRDFGLFTAENGIFFRLKADGLLYAVLRSGGVETIEELIDTSVLNDFDVEKNNTYDIQFQWRSAGNYYFFIGCKATGAARLVHTFNLLGTLTSASIENPAMPIAFKATRNTQDVEMNVGCADVTSENGDTDKEQYGSTRAKNYSGAGADFPALVIHNPLQEGGVTNTRTITLARITCNSSKKTALEIWTTRDQTAFTGMTLGNVNFGSFVQTDSPDADVAAVRATAVDLAKLRYVTTINVEANVRAQTDNPYRGRIEFPLVRGDYLVATCEDATASVSVVYEWGEQI